MGRARNAANIPLCAGHPTIQTYPAQNMAVLRLRKLILTLGGNTGLGSEVGFRASGRCLSQVGFLERARARVFKLGGPRCFEAISWLACEEERL